MKLIAHVVENLNLFCGRWKNKQRYFIIFTRQSLTEFFVEAKREHFEYTRSCLGIINIQLRNVHRSWKFFRMNLMLMP